MARKSADVVRCALCNAKDVVEPRGDERYCRECWEKKIAVEDIVAREFTLKRYIRAQSAEKYLVYHSTQKRPVGLITVIDDGFDLFLTLLLVPDALLAFELLLHGFVDEPLLLDLGQPDDLRLRGGLESCQRVDSGFCLLLLGGEFVAGLRDVGHDRVELVQVRDDRVRGHRCQDVGGEDVVGLVEIDEQREVGPAGADVLADGLRLEAVAHLVGASLDGGQLLLCLGDLEFELGDLRLLVEHLLSCCVCPVAGGLDLPCGPFGR